MSNQKHYLNFIVTQDNDLMYHIKGVKLSGPGCGIEESIPFTLSPAFAYEITPYEDIELDKDEKFVSIDVGRFVQTLYYHSGRFNHERAVEEAGRRRASQAESEQDDTVAELPGVSGAGREGTA